MELYCSRFLSRDQKRAKLQVSCILLPSPRILQKLLWHRCVCSEICRRDRDHQRSSLRLALQNSMQNSNHITIMFTEPYHGCNCAFTRGIGEWHLHFYQVQVAQENNTEWHWSRWMSLTSGESGAWKNTPLAYSVSFTDFLPEVKAAWKYCKFNHLTSRCSWSLSSVLWISTRKGMLQHISVTSVPSSAKRGW